MTVVLTPVEIKTKSALVEKKLEYIAFKATKTYQSPLYFLSIAKLQNGFSPILELEMNKLQSLAKDIKASIPQISDPVDKQMAITEGVKSFQFLADYAAKDGNHLQKAEYLKEAAALLKLWPKDAPPYVFSEAQKILGAAFSLYALIDTALPAGQKGQYAQEMKMLHEELGELRALERAAIVSFDETTHAAPNRYLSERAVGNSDGGFEL